VCDLENSKTEEAKTRKWVVKASRIIIISSHIAEAQVHSQLSLFGICGGQSFSSVFQFSLVSVSVQENPNHGFSLKTHSTVWVFVKFDLDLVKFFGFMFVV
jgi:hypothetical protein